MFKKLNIGFHDFEVGDIITAENKERAYIITKVKKCSCPCNKTKYMKILYLDSMGKNYFYFNDITNKREVLRWSIQQ